MRAVTAAVSLALTVGLLGARPVAAVTLTRHPSVWLQTPTSVLIAWQTDAPAAGKILFGISTPTGGEAAHAGTTTDHSVAVTGLTPSSQYFYRVISGPDTLTDGSDTFRTAPATVEPFRFLAFGDPGRATPEQIQVAARIDSLNADLAILTGDIIYEGGEAANFTLQYFDIYRTTIARTPFYPCLGNHDVVTSNGQPYLDAFYLPINNPPANERYYSFDFSNAHFVALEVTVENAAPSAAMLSWLDADLAATTKHWKFVFFHVPMYSNPGGHGGDPVITTALEPILNARGVDMVFAGHNHFYTRTFPIAGGAVVGSSQNPFYVNPGGAIHIVTGGAGRSLHALSGANAYEAFSKSTFHTTVIDVNGTALSLAAVERDGTVFDAMTLTKDTPTGVAQTEGPPEPPDGPLRFAAGLPRPNPSEGATEIRFTLDRPSRVQIAIFNSSGRWVRTLDSGGSLAAGVRELEWDGRDRRGGEVAAGIYFAEIQAGGRAVRTRVVRLR
jgi:3',5'-cyclic AMP phosphodiesterase CpdA